MILILAGTAVWFQRDIPLSHPEYWLDLDLEGNGPFSAGASKIPITPSIGKGEEVWLAGYHVGRAATGVHDDLWARAVVIRCGEVTIALVALDLIGIFQEEVISIRKALDGEIDYVIVASTHTHSGPDTMGLWGPTRFRTGVREKYQEKVRVAVIRAIREAASRLEPSSLVFARRDLAPRGLLRDSRKPIVMDTELSICAIRPRAGGDAIATLVNWSCHPEVMDSKNTLVSSDFP
ncbi:MAG: neutral/alkaline non-lysosomal ceramidase N-terminal domain-containing protein, partial [Planctomycetota bacterium]|nr:neutral/alkaline non-lysosomal ceramidase N-terminal domain-containing protein [Planctomycetota bacterium]